MEYKVIEAKDEALNLEAEVNRHIQDGWVPVGGVAVGYSPQSYTWFGVHPVIMGCQRVYPAQVFTEGWKTPV